MLPRSSATPIGTRNSSPARRGISRGGIQKRRNGPGRVDKDGDLVMDAGTGTELRGGRGRPDGSRSRGRASGRAGHSSGTARGGIGIQQAQQAIIRGLDSQQANVLVSRISHGTSGDRAVKELRVHGLKESKAASKPDGGLKDLLLFLERKATGVSGDPRRPVRIKKSHLDGDDVIVTASHTDTESLLKINGFAFAGTTLGIEEYNQGTISTTKKDEAVMSEEAQKTQEKIKSILSTRYDVNLKLLNLSALGQDAGLVQMGMFDAQKRISKLFPVLMVVCDRLFASAEEKRDAIVSVTLTDNELDSVSTVTSLAQTFPDLLNLDLSRNKFVDLHSLEGWRWRFRKLQNLRITENPLDPGTLENKAKIVKWFPALQILNGIQVRTADEALESVEASPGSHLVSPIPICGPDFRDVNQIGEGFIKQFFPLYDTDRSALANAFYDPQSVLSISINLSAPRSEQESHSRIPWADALFRQSRNLHKLKGSSQQMSKVFRGVDAIRSLWAEIPPTTHPDLATNPADYLIDCHPSPGLSDPNGQSPKGVDGLLLMVHGQFEDMAASKEQLVQRSFSRTFILGPGAPGSPPIRVISDILILRAWSPLAPTTQSTAKGTPPTAIATQVTQEELLRQLVLRTQMTPEFAAMCLMETGWDLEKAFVAFNENKSKLPPNAFVNMAKKI